MVIKVGIVGCGYWGKNLIRNFVQLGGGTLKYCCDSNESTIKKIEEVYPHIKITKDYQELLDSDVEAIVIATPVSTHYKLARQALIKNKHVLIEKPITNNIEHARELLEIAKRNNMVLMIDHTFEYSPAINKMKEIIKNRELGELFYIRANWLNLGLLQQDINVTWDLCVHIFSIINYVLDEEPVSVSANGKGFIRDNIEEVATITLKFKDKKIANINVSWLESKKVREFAIIGSKKMVVYDLINLPEQIKIYEGGVDVINYDANSIGFNYRTGDIYAPNLRNIEPLHEVCNYFLDSIKNGTKPKTDAESGIKTLRILEAVEESLKNNGREVHIKND